MDTRLKMLKAATVVLGLTLAANFGCTDAGHNSPNAPADKVCGSGTEEALSAKDQAIVDEVRASGINVMTAAELKTELGSEKPPIVVDVLTVESYAAGHIRGSISLPADEIQGTAARRLPDKSARIVVYCAGFQCGASTAAARELQKMGYANVYDFKGGLEAWRELGGPIERSRAGG
jgi:rhodanese-related sulfurtransferase